MMIHYSVIGQSVIVEIISPYVWNLKGVLDLYMRLLIVVNNKIFLNSRSCYWYKYIAYQVKLLIDN
jgi:hypothetical protein